jgi:hypothetical protein
MSVTLSPLAGAGWQFFDNNGVPLAGGLLYTYAAGTTTPLATYTTFSGNIANTNPIVLDAAGRLSNELWLSLGYGYKFVLKDATANLIGTYDNIPSNAAAPFANDAGSISYEEGYTATAGAFIVGQSYLIVSVGTTNFVSIGATSNAVGVYFTATGVGSGTGTAKLSRSVQSKLQESVSVLDFGAVGNGTTDDYAPFVAALAAATSIFIPAGYTFYIGSALAVPNGRTIYGTGTILFALSTGFNVGSNVNIQDITITGSNTVRTSIVADYCMKTPSIGVKCNSNRYTNLKISNFGAGIHALGTNITIQSCLFTNIGPSTGGISVVELGSCINGWQDGHGAFLSGSNIQILNNTTISCAGLSTLLGATGCLIDGNYCDGATYLGIGQQGCDNLTISNNYIQNTFDNGIDCQSCWNTVISSNHIINAGTSTSGATGDRKSIFWGSDSELRPMYCSIVGNIIEQTAAVSSSEVKAGINTTFGGKITITGNTFKNVLSIVKSSGVTISDNIFYNCETRFFTSTFNLANNAAVNSLFYTDSCVASNITANNFDGYFSTNTYMLDITGLSAGSVRMLVSDNNFTTSNPRSIAYFGIQTTSTVTSINVLNNVIDSAYLIKDTPNRIPTLYSNNTSFVYNNNPDNAYNTGSKDVIFYTGAAQTAATISIPTDSFQYRTSTIAVTCFSASYTACVQKTYLYCAFNGGNGAAIDNLTLVSTVTVGSSTDFSSAIVGSNIVITPSGAGATAGVFLVNKVI